MTFFLLLGLTSYSQCKFSNCFALVGISLLFLLATIVTFLFLGTTCTKLTHLLFDMGYMIPTSCSQLISFFTTSIMKELSLIQFCLTSLAFSLSQMQCMHMVGLIPLMSASVHLMVILFSFKIAINFSPYNGE